MNKKFSPATQNVVQQHRFIFDAAVPNSFIEHIMEEMDHHRGRPGRELMDRLSEMLSEFMGERIQERCTAYKELFEHVNYLDQEYRSVILIEQPDFFDLVLFPTEDDKLAKKTSAL